jgi:REP element-mobilizing transposase RayT
LASRNERKPSHAAAAYFHVYNRGVNGDAVFRSGTDYREFLQCFRRHLSTDDFRDSHNRPYRKLHRSVTLIAYCLMPNHFHLVLRQSEPDGMSRLMRSAMIGYGQYFNNRYDRYGPLFQGRYKASLIDTRTYAQRAIAYVHLNHPEQGLAQELTSHRLFVESARCDWIDASQGVAFYGDRAAYLAYLDAYQLKRKALPLPKP